MLQQKRYERDLDMLHKEGQLTKIHGGAIKKKDQTLEFYSNRAPS